MAVCLVQPLVMTDQDPLGAYSTNLAEVAKRTHISAIPSKGKLAHLPVAAERSELCVGLYVHSQIDDGSGQRPFRLFVGMVSVPWVQIYALMMQDACKRSNHRRGKPAAALTFQTTIRTEIRSLYAYEGLGALADEAETDSTVRSILKNAAREVSRGTLFITARLQLDSYRASKDLAWCAENASRLMMEMGAEQTAYSKSLTRYCNAYRELFPQRGRDTGGNLVLKTFDGRLMRFEGDTIQMPRFHLPVWPIGNDHLPFAEWWHATLDPNHPSDASTEAYFLTLAVLGLRRAQIDAETAIRSINEALRSTVSLERRRPYAIRESREFARLVRSIEATFYALSIPALTTRYVSDIAYVNSNRRISVEAPQQDALAGVTDATDCEDSNKMNAILFYLFRRGRPDLSGQWKHPLLSAMQTVASVYLSFNTFATVKGAQLSDAAKSSTKAPDATTSILSSSTIRVGDATPQEQRRRSSRQLMARLSDERHAAAIEAEREGTLYVTHTASLSSDTNAYLNSLNERGTTSLDILAGENLPECCLRDRRSHPRAFWLAAVARFHPEWIKTLFLFECGLHFHHLLRRYKHHLKARAAYYGAETFWCNLALWLDCYICTTSTAKPSRACYRHVEKNPAFQKKLAVITKIFEEIKRLFNGQNLGKDMKGWSAKRVRSLLKDVVRALGELDVPPWPIDGNAVVQRPPRIVYTVDKDQQQQPYAERPSILDSVKRKVANQGYRHHLEVLARQLSKSFRVELTGSDILDKLQPYLTSIASDEPTKDVVLERLQRLGRRVLTSRLTFLIDFIDTDPARKPDLNRQMTVLEDADGTPMLRVREAGVETTFSVSEAFEKFFATPDLRRYAALAYNDWLLQRPYDPETELILWADRIVFSWLEEGGGSKMSRAAATTIGLLTEHLLLALLPVSLKSSLSSSSSSSLPPRSEAKIPHFKIILCESGIGSSIAPLSLPIGGRKRKQQAQEDAAAAAPRLDVNDEPLTLHELALIHLSEARGVSPSELLAWVRSSVVLSRIEKRKPMRFWLHMIEMRRLNVVIAFLSTIRDIFQDAKTALGWISMAVPRSSDQRAWRALLPWVDYYVRDSLERICRRVNSRRTRLNGKVYSYWPSEDVSRIHATRIGEEDTTTEFAEVVVTLTHREFIDHLGLEPTDDQGATLALLMHAAALRQAAEKEQEGDETINHVQYRLQAMDRVVLALAAVISVYQSNPIFRRSSSVPDRLWRPLRQPMRDLRARMVEAVELIMRSHERTTDGDAFLPEERTPATVRSRAVTSEGVVRVNSGRCSDEMRIADPLSPPIEEDETLIDNEADYHAAIGGHMFSLFVPHYALHSLYERYREDILSPLYGPSNRDTPMDRLAQYVSSQLSKMSPSTRSQVDLDLSRAICELLPVIVAEGTGRQQGLLLPAEHYFGAGEELLVRAAENLAAADCVEQWNERPSRHFVKVEASSPNAPSVTGGGGEEEEEDNDGDDVSSDGLAAGSAGLYAFQPRLFIKGSFRSDAKTGKTYARRLTGFYRHLGYSVSDGLLEIDERFRTLVWVRPDKMHFGANLRHLLEKGPALPIPMPESLAASYLDDPQAVSYLKRCAQRVTPYALLFDTTLSGDVTVPLTTPLPSRHDFSSIEDETNPSSLPTERAYGVVNIPFRSERQNLCLTATDLPLVPSLSLGSSTASSSSSSSLPSTEPSEERQPLVFAVDTGTPLAEVVRSASKGSNRLSIPAQACCFITQPNAGHLKRAQSSASIVAASQESVLPSTLPILRLDTERSVLFQVDDA
jgi:hypothetical protein